MVDPEERIRLHREFLKDSLRKHFNFSTTDQNRGIPPPPVEKPCPEGATVLRLPAPETFDRVCSTSLLSVLRSRRSVRQYSPAPLSLSELSFLLWATQGITERRGDYATLRPVPSAGGRHALDTYLYAQRVSDVPAGLYRYLPVEHALVFEFEVPDFSHRISRATFGQRFIGSAAAVFFWAAVPYRAEWRYGPAAHRTLAMDAGHVCQNLYLAAEAIAAGACAVGAYDQQGVDALLRLEGEEEFTLYLASVGKKP